MASSLYSARGEEGEREGGRDQRATKTERKADNKIRQQTKTQRIYIQLPRIDTRADMQLSQIACGFYGGCV